MRWLKRDTWKAGIAVAGMMLLLVLMLLIPLSAVGAHERVPLLATPITVQATPTEDATVVAAQKDKIVQDDIAANNANNWWRTDVAALITAIGGLGVLISATLGIWIGFRGANVVRVAAQEQQKDQLFQNTISGLGSERNEARAIAASMLLTFLQQPGYERFHQQIFNLAATNLRLRPVEPSTPERLDPLSQALITVFKESFPLARKALIGQENPQLKELEALDASRIRLDNAFLRHADLEGIWMRDAFLSDASLRKVNLSNASLTKTDFSDAYLHYANLSGARLRHAVLSRAHLKGACLRGAYLASAHLDGANLYKADLRGADLRDADLDGAILQGAKYNTKKIQEKDGQGNLVTIEPTQWPQKFNPSDTKWGLICVDC